MIPSKDITEITEDILLENILGKFDFKKLEMLRNLSRMDKKAVKSGVKNIFKYFFCYKFTLDFL
jgi:hypothetical protein